MGFFFLRLDKSLTIFKVCFTWDRNTNWHFRPECPGNETNARWGQRWKAQPWKQGKQRIDPSALEQFWTESRVFKQGDTFEKGNCPYPGSSLVLAQWGANKMLPLPTVSQFLKALRWSPSVSLGETDYSKWMKWTQKKWWYFFQVIRDWSCSRLSKSKNWWMPTLFFFFIFYYKSAIQKSSFQQFSTVINLRSNTRSKQLAYSCAPNSPQMCVTEIRYALFTEGQAAGKRGHCAPPLLRALSSWARFEKTKKKKKKINYIN